MADIKQIYSRKNDTTYNIKDEVARQGLEEKQDKIDSVSVDYQEDGGSPDASAQFEDGALAISMKNMKMKFSELTEEEKAELKGQKGEPGDVGIYNPEAPDAPDFVMAQTTGQSTTKAMTQKAVTDELLYDFSKEIDFSEYTPIHAYIYPASNGQVQWRDDSSNYCYFIPVTPGTFIKLVDRGANELGYQWCFLSTDEWTDFGIVTTAVESGDGNNWSTATQTFCVPQGAAFLYVRYKAGGVVITPYTYIGVKIKEKIEELESQVDESLDSLSESLDTTNENVSANREKAENDLHNHAIYDWVGNAVSIPTAHNQYVTTAGKWTQGGPSSGRSSLVPVTPGDTLRVAPIIDESGEEPVPVSYRVFFVTDGEYHDSGYPAYASGCSFPELASYEKTMIVPYDATHLYVWFSDGNGTVRAPSIFRLVEQNEKISKLSSDLDDASNKLLQEIRNAAVGHNYPMSAKQGNLAFSGGTVVYNSSANYGIYYSLAPLKKGDLVYVYGTSGTARNQYYAFTPVDPSTLETLVGLEYDNQSSFGSSKTHEHVLVVPYDGAYLLRYQAYAFDMGIYKIPFGYDRGRGSDAASQVGGYLNLKRMVNNHRKNGSVSVLLYFSDPHNAVSALAQAAQIKSSVPGIDDVLCGGDNVNDQPNDDYPFFHESLGGKGRTMLTVVGNHDVYQSGTKLPQKDVYDIYFGEHATYWNGVTFPENAVTDGKCYWHKDYASAKVRLIGLDCINWSNAQGTWLSDVLADAITNNYHVVICMHYQCYQFQGKRDCNWNSFKSVDGSSSHASEQVCSIVQDAVDNGLKFICYLGGHHHRDYFGFSADYPNQGMFGTDKPTPGASVNDADREAAACYYSVKDREYWCFNIISINTTYGVMNIDRIGNNRDMMGRPMNHMTYDYINSVIIEQS